MHCGAYTPRGVTGITVEHLHDVRSKIAVGSGPVNPEEQKLLRREWVRWSHSPSGAAEITINLEGYISTQGGRRKLGSGTATSAAGKSPGVVVPLILTVATTNPLGLIVMLPLKVGQEVTGRNKVEGVGKRMADKIADELEIKLREQGWIDR